MKSNKIEVCYTYYQLVINQIDIGLFDENQNTMQTSKLTLLPSKYNPKCNFAELMYLQYSFCDIDSSQIGLE